MDAPEAASLTWGPGPFSTLGAAVSHQPVGQEQGVVAVEDDARLMQVIVSLGGTPGDPGGPAQADLALDDQRVSRLPAEGVAIVELVGSEEAAGEEGVGSSEELGPRTHLAAVKGARGSGRAVRICREPLSLCMGSCPRTPCCRPQLRAGLLQPQFP